MISNPLSASGIDAELQHGERVLWVGRPTPLRIALQNREALVTGALAVAALFVLLFALPASILGVFVAVCGFPWVFLFFGLLTFYYLIRPVSEYLSAERTIYAVTDRRVLIIRPKLGGKIVKSYSRIGHVERRELGGGSGDLIFGSETEVRGRTSRHLKTRPVGFIGIANVREVERLMLEALTGSDGPQWL